MGNCGGTPSSYEYKYNQKSKIIPKKDVDTITKWTKGALARRRFRKLVITNGIASK